MERLRLGILNFRTNLFSLFVASGLYSCTHLVIDDKQIHVGLRL
jgi:hypothetical protein